MKIKSILAMMKSCKRIYVVQHGGVQWIGDGENMYPLFNMPLLSQAHIYKLLDVPEDKRGNYLYIDGTEQMSHKLFEDSIEADQEIEIMNTIIIRKGRTLNIAISNGEISFIDVKSLAPFDEDITLEKRGHFIAVKEGMILVGLIKPISIIDEEFIKEFKLMYELVKKKQKEE